MCPEGVPPPPPLQKERGRLPPPLQKKTNRPPTPLSFVGGVGDPPGTVASMEGYISGCNPGDRYCHCQRKIVHLWQNESVYLATFMHEYVSMSKNRDGGLFHDM